MRLIKNSLFLLFLFPLTLISCKVNQVPPPVADSLPAPEWSKDAIIYEINVRQYSPAGDLRR